MLEFIEYIIRIIQVIPWLVMGASLVAALTPVSYTHLRAHET